MESISHRRIGVSTFAEPRLPRLPPPSLPRWVKTRGAAIIVIYFRGGARRPSSGGIMHCLRVVRINLRPATVWSASVVCSGVVCLFTLVVSICQARPAVDEALPFRHRGGALVGGMQMLMNSGC